MGWANDSFFLSVVESSIDCVRVLDLESRVQFINAVGRRLLEIDDFTVVEGRYWPGLWPAETRDQLIVALDEALRGKTSRLRAEGPTRSGALKAWDTTICPLLGPAGNVAAILAWSRDVTEQVHTERDLARMAAALSSAARIAKVGGWELDPENMTVYFSPELGMLLERPDASVLSLDEALQYWLPEDRHQFREAIQAALASGDRLAFEGRIETRSEVRWLRVLGQVESSASGAALLRGAAQDVTEERNAMDRLLASETRAQASAAAMSSFLATMSHEIRTPLNGVLGLADVMSRGSLDAEQKERLDLIQKSGRILLALLNDLLDLSRIESGQLQLEDGLLSVEDLSESAQSTFHALAQDKDLALTVEVGSSARGAFHGDPNRVRQIVTNLVSNAVKFTPSGGVRVRFGHDRDALLIEVEDTGVGIPAERLPLIFDRFVQADASTTRRYGGSGLGLAICRDLARLMGGEIKAENTPGGGARFLVSLPARPAERASAPAAAAAHDPDTPRIKRPLRILAAEDNPTNQHLLKTLLRQAGVDIALVGNGEEALATWRCGAWDLLLMDVQMPVMDGVTAIRLIRHEEQLTGRPRTPILVLTANAMDHQTAEYRACGADGVVPKPMNLHLLFSSIDAVMQSAADAHKVA